MERSESIFELQSNEEIYQFNSIGINYTQLDGKIEYSLQTIRLILSIFKYLSIQLLIH